ncbi:zinc finger protein weckle [Drosophila novamexicana]|uniref:zinc finger protein weckle n=1 Tax=Drosophila novamexicana TaxID=47314 RepID=UPI0011E59379|nr:zinc finger protein weckle [Drosophila novamexicana]
MAADEQQSAPSDWLLWCRLCAKDDLQGNINVFLKNEQTAAPGEQMADGNGAAAGAAAVSDMALATAIGKYFWVNITRGEELPEMICSECLSLVTSLVNFSERITRVQKLYCILQSTPKDSVNMQELRARFGLLEERHQQLEAEPETLTEVHYVEEKPKLTELEETSLELENPLTPCVQSVETKTVDQLERVEAAAVDQEDQLEDEDEQAEEADVEEQELEQEQSGYEDAGTELLLNLCEVYSQDETNSLDSAKPVQPKPHKARPGKSYQCSECPRIYALPQTLQRHMRQDHDKTEADSTKLIACEQCEKQFRSRYQLQRHMQQHLPMPKRKRYPCGSCGKKFTTNASAQSHAQYMHQEERPRPVICEQCGVAVHSLHALKEHLLSHTDYAPYECDVCKKCFKSISRLKHHKETHDPHKYICPECGMQLNSRPTLNRHRLVHTDQMQHKCDYCGREFKRAKALKNHLILHTGLKPYSCDFCDRTFANGSNCRTHKKKSHPEELAAQEAAGGGKSYNRNIPKLEALKAFTKNKDNLSPVATKQSGCFAFGKKPKAPTAKAAELPFPSPATGIPTIENIYNHLMKPEVPPQPQQQLVLASDGSASILPVEHAESSTTQIFSY